MHQLGRVILSVAASLWLAGCPPASIKESCSKAGLPRCEAGQAIQCAYSAGIAGYSVAPDPLTCADGTVCDVVEILDGTERLDQAYCFVTPETSCDPADSALRRCVSETVVELCAAEPAKLVRYGCGAEGDGLPEGCEPTTRTCQATN